MFQYSRLQYAKPTAGMEMYSRDGTIIRMVPHTNYRLEQPSENHTDAPMHRSTKL